MLRPNRFSLKLTLITLAGLLTTAFPIFAGDGASVSGINPSQGQTTPGVTITLSGSGFLPGLRVFFDGLESRSVKVTSPGSAEVVTPYLRPGDHEIEIQTASLTTKSNIAFTAIRTEIDSPLDHAETLAKSGDVDGALASLDNVINDTKDLQVRAYAYYRKAQLYYARGDLSNWQSMTASVFLNSDLAGKAIQSSWRYRLAQAESTYLMDNVDPTVDGRFADLLVKFDVTRNPETRFYRSLVSLRTGDVVKAKTDSDAILRISPTNASYRALAVLIAVTSGDKASVAGAKESDFTVDPRAAALFGEAAYIAGDVSTANRVWILSQQHDRNQVAVAFLAAKKHLANKQTAIARLLLAEAIAMDPQSEQAAEAQELLSKL
jgi:tetratricopeptide (TPR) repeat protein